MTDILIRNVPPEKADALTRLAQAAGKDRQEWLLEKLIELAEGPIVYHRYILSANTGPTYVEIRRTEDSLNDPRPFLRNLNEEQRAAFEQALIFVKRNGPGDREAAIAALSRGFENVRESLI